MPMKYFTSKEELRNTIEVGNTRIERENQIHLLGITNDQVF